MEKIAVKKLMAKEYMWHFCSDHRNVGQEQAKKKRDRERRAEDVREEDCEGDMLCISSTIAI